VSRYRTTAFVYGVPLGGGGLGVQAGNALRALSLASDHVHAIGPGPGNDERAKALANVSWHIPRPLPRRWLRWTPLRRRAGLAQYWADRRVGRYAASTLDRLRPTLCYTFTQVGLEPLEWARAAGVPSVVESPNGHIRAFRAVYVEEARRWCGTAFPGHPTPSMVSRVERELEVADRVRVSSEWSRASLAAGGVTPARITSLQQPVDLARYAPIPCAAAGGPLRVCFSGSLDLRKGFVYLLQAVRLLTSTVPVRLHLVGATGDRCSRALLARERNGLDVTSAPGDPRVALAAADLFVLPTLEDGSPFAVAEAMACARPVVTTDSTGAAEWIRPGRSGWIVPARSAEHLAEALAQAAGARSTLPEMGLAARRDTEARAGAGCDDAVAEWLTQR
jgi:glycosyltransferase involved in cell wall biosynthesis